MKNYQGLVELSVRKYLGPTDISSNWELIKFAIGIKLDGEVYDYKTLEKYNFLSRNENGVINAQPKDLVVGNIYAIDTGKTDFYINEACTDYEINKYIKESGWFSDEYKKAKSKGKQLLKQIK